MPPKQIQSDLREIANRFDESARYGDIFASRRIWSRGMPGKKRCWQKFFSPPLHFDSKYIQLVKSGKMGGWKGVGSDSTELIADNIFRPELTDENRTCTLCTLPCDLVKLNIKDWRINSKKCLAKKSTNCKSVMSTLPPTARQQARDLPSSIQHCSYVASKLLLFRNFRARKNDL